MTLEEAVPYPISIDTRSLNAGDVYVAIVGEALDGHQFVLDAKLKGARAAVVAQGFECDAIELIHVDNTREALMQLGKWRLAHWRSQQPQGKIAAVTGSYGKTTVRAMCENIFALCGNTVANVGSFNNDLGVPLTMLRLQQDTEFYMQEVGANHLGELSYLSDALQPDVAAITTIDAVHLEGFGSLDNIAKAKSEIFAGLKSGGVAVVNVDNPYADFVKQQAGAYRILTFGIDQPADISARAISILDNGCASFRLLLPGQEAIVTLQLLGRHNVINALAAAAMSVALGLQMDAIKAGLEATPPVNKRLNIHELDDEVVVIDDSYNASPSAVLAAVDVLNSFDRRSVVVLGDMSELGPEEVVIHEQLGQSLKAQGVARLYAFGPLMRHAVSGFGDGAAHFKDKPSLIEAVLKEKQLRTAILVKGSNSQKMWQVVEGLLA